MNDESSYISFNMTMPIETKWRPFFVPVAKHVRILSQVAKYNFFMDRKCCNSSNTIIPI